MKYFAEVNNENVVVQVITVKDDALVETVFPASNKAGQDFLANLGLRGTFIECCYESQFRGCYPGPGYTYDSALDVFVAPFFNQDNNMTGLETV